MEGAPLTPEYNNDDIERREKHKPKAETIGSLAVETSPEKDSDRRKRSPEHLGQALISKEALQGEESYEKDPVLRHSQGQGAVSKVSASIGSLLSSKSDLSLGSGALVGDDTDGNTEQRSKSSKLAAHQWSAADIAMFSVITFLIILIILVIIIKS